MKLNEFLHELADQDLDATDPVIHHRGILHMGIQQLPIGPNPAHNKIWRVQAFGTRDVSVQIMSYSPNRTQVRVVFEGRWFYAVEPAGVVALNRDQAQQGDPFDGVARFDLKRVYAPGPKVPAPKGGNKNKVKT